MGSFDLHCMLEIFVLLGRIWRLLVWKFSNRKKIPQIMAVGKWHNCVTAASRRSWNFVASQCTRLKLNHWRCFGIFWHSRKEMNRLRVVAHSFLFMMCSNGRRKSFWNLKLASSPLSTNFMASCLRESTTKNDTSSLGKQPTCSKGQHQHSKREPWMGSMNAMQPSTILCARSLETHKHIQVALYSR